MHFTGDMIQRGVSDALDLGVLPRHCIADDISINDELMTEILQAALEVTSEALHNNATSRN